MMWFLRYGAWRTEFSGILDRFWRSYPPNNLKNQNFEKRFKKWIKTKQNKTADFIILNMCTQNNDHMMYCLWDMTDGQKKWHIEVDVPPKKYSHFQAINTNNRKHFFRFHVKKYWHSHWVAPKRYETLSDVKQYWHFIRVPSKLNYSKNLFQSTYHTIMTLSESYYQTLLTYSEHIKQYLHFHRVTTKQY